MENPSSDLPETADIQEQSCDYPGCNGGLVWSPWHRAYFVCPACMGGKTTDIVFPERLGREIPV